MLRCMGLLLEIIRFSFCLPFSQGYKSHFLLGLRDREGQF